MSCLSLQTALRVCAATLNVCQQINRRCINVAAVFQVNSSYVTFALRSLFSCCSGVGILIDVMEWANLVPDDVRQALSDRTLPDVVFAFSISTLAIHVLAARCWLTNFASWVWAVRIGLNALFMTCLLLVGLTLVIVSLALPDRLSATMGATTMRDMQVATALGTFTIATPFFLARMHSSQSFGMMVSCFAAYFLFLPTILGDFFSYSLARYDDLSWVSGFTYHVAKTLAEAK